MAFDDPIVWILILVVVVVLFGASRIPKFARAFGRSKEGIFRWLTRWNAAHSINATASYDAVSTSSLASTFA